MRPRRQIRPPCRRPGALEPILLHKTIVVMPSKPPCAPCSHQQGVPRLRDARRARPRSVIEESLCTPPSHAQQTWGIYTTQAEFESDLPIMSAACGAILGVSMCCAWHWLGNSYCNRLGPLRFGIHPYLPRSDTTACKAIRERAQQLRTKLWEQRAKKAPDVCGLMAKASSPHRVCGLSNDTR